MMTQFWRIIDWYVNLDKSWQAVDWVLTIVHFLCMWGLLICGYVIGGSIMWWAALTLYVALAGLSAMYKRRMGWHWAGPSVMGLLGSVLLAIPAACAQWLAWCTKGKGECDGVFAGWAMFDIFFFGVLLCLGMADFTLKQFNHKCEK